MRTTIIAFLIALSFPVHAKPMKVYILAGQSNMLGNAKIGTFDYIGDDPATAPMLKDMVGADGKPVTCDNAWISYFTGEHKNGESIGKLTAGYGARHNIQKSDGKIGPEFTFGIYMQKHVKEPILIIKTSWGGKSISNEFRPPSAGPYKLCKLAQKKFAENPNGAHGIPSENDRPEWWRRKQAGTSVCYRAMIKHVKHVLSDIKRIYPGYDEKQGYELAGFVWFQGWNDLWDWQAYWPDGKPDRFALYSKLLSIFIREVRKDLKAPKMPFVIGVIGVRGVDGLTDEKNGKDPFREAMRAPAKMPEFKGNVVAVETAPFWPRELAAIERKINQVNGMRHALRNRDKNHANADGEMTEEEQRKYVENYRKKLLTPEDELKWKRGASDGGFHYMGCAKTMAQIGKAFADALAEMAPSHPLPPNRLPGDTRQ